MQTSEDGIFFSIGKAACRSHLRVRAPFCLAMPEGEPSCLRCNQKPADVVHCPQKFSDASDVNRWFCMLDCLALLGVRQNPVLVDDDTAEVDAGHAELAF